MNDREAQEFSDIVHMLLKISSSVKTDERGYLNRDALPYNLAVILSIIAEVCDLDRSEIDEIIGAIPLYIDALENTK